jgi:hypothetical protein
VRVVSAAFDRALDASKALGSRVSGPSAAIERAEIIGAEIPNQLQPVVGAIDHLENLLNDHATQSPETREALRDARAGLANVLELAKRLRGDP